MRPPKRTERIPVVAALCSLFVVSILAANPAVVVGAERVLKSASGVVRDDAGDPAPNADVWLCLNGTAFPPGPATLLTQTTTDNQGRYSVSANVSIDASVEPKPIVYLLVRDEKKRLTWRILTPANQPGQEAADLTIGETVSWTAQIATEAGEPAANVPVHVTDLFVKPGKNKSEVRLVLPTEIQSELLVTSDEAGSATSTTQVPAKSVRVRLEVVGFKTGRSIRPGSKPAQFLVQPLGSLTGRIQGISEKKNLDRARVRCTKAPEEGQGEVLFTIAGEADVNVRADGTFRVDGLQAGRYYVHLISVPPPGPLSITFAEHVADFPYYSDKTDVVEVRAFQVTGGVEIKALKAARVRGQVVDEESAKGVPNLKLQLWSRADDRYSDYLSRQRVVVTDNDGKFVSYIPPGSLAVSIQQTSPDYLPLNWSFGGEEITAEQGKDVDYPLIRLRRTKELTLRVIGDDGKPVANAQVQVDGSGHSSNESANAEGVVVIKGLDPSLNVFVRARHGKSTNDSLTKIDPSKLNGPVEIRISEKCAFSVVGKVIDDSGRPVPRAVILGTHGKKEESADIPYASSGSLERWTTDQNGDFRVEGLWPFDRYCFEISIEAHSGFCTPWIQGVPGQPFELPPVVLHESKSEVVGVVVDSNGQAVTEALVYCPNDGAKPVSVKSDKSGRFRLKGLYRGSVLLFAKKAGCQLTSQEVQSGAMDVRMTILRADEPVTPVLLEGPSLELLSERRQLGEWIVEQILSKYDQAGVLVSRDVLSPLALVDPEEALARSALFDEGVVHWIQMELVPALCRRSPETALELARQLPPEMGTRAALNAAIRLIDDQTEWALRFTQEAIAASRSLDAPDRASSLAEASGLYVHLGIPDQGGLLAAQAADLVAKIEKTEANFDARSIVALALMRFDAKRAAELIPEKETDQERGPAQLRLTLLLGRVNVEEYLKDDPNGENPWKTFELVRAKAPEPAEALGLAMSIPDDSMRFQAIQVLMQSAAKHNPQLAETLFQECLAITESRISSDLFPFDYGDGTGVGDLLISAYRWRLPFLERLVPLVQSQPFRRAGELSWSSIAKVGYREAGRLAIVDIPSARRMLGAVRRIGYPVQSEEYEFGQQEYLIALALLQPSEAKKEIEAFLAKHKILVGLEGGQDGGLAWLASLLTVPPEETAEILQRRNHYYYFEAEPQLEIFLRPSQ